LGGDFSLGGDNNNNITGFSLGGDNNSNNNTADFNLSDNKDHKIKVDLTDGVNLLGAGSPGQSSPSSPKKDESLFNVDSHSSLLIGTHKDNKEHLLDFEIESYHPFTLDKPMDSISKESGISDVVVDDDDNMLDKEISFYVEAPCTVSLLGVESSAFGYPNLRAFVQENVTLGVLVDNLKDNKSIDVRCTCKKTFPSGSFNLDPNSRDVVSTEWINFVACGYRGAFASLSKFIEPRAFDIIASGSIGKIISGELSPSALVVASARATAHANGFEISDEYLSNLAQDYVKFVGIGADIHRDTIEDCSPVVLPSDVCVCVTQMKSSSSPKQSYDVKDSTLMEVEGKLAVKIMALNLRLHHTTCATFRDIQVQMEKRVGKAVKLSGMKLIAETNIHDGAYTRREILRIFKIKKLHNLFTESERVRFRRVLETAQFFCCRQRACYAYEEARRIKIFRSVLVETKDIKTFAQVLTDSDENYCDLTNIEDVECEELASLCSRLSAFGTRCFHHREPKIIVSLIESKKASDFVQDLKKDSHVSTNVRSIDFYEFPSRVPQLSLLKDGPTK
ncbi:hypothetical protein OAV88_01695, partial [bacterium]|nr:hypothetical protein [bacterium]